MLSCLIIFESSRHLYPKQLPARNTQGHSGGLGGDVYSEWTMSSVVYGSVSA